MKMEKITFAAKVLAVSSILLVMCNGKQPHVIIIVADDLGWNDVSFHGSPQILTPNLDDLALNGVILFNYYVQHICTPTRSALLTGRYPIHTGLQHDTIAAGQPYGLGLNETTMATHLRGLGYKTHAVGKWHLGFFKKDYIPINRGFDTFYGYYNGKSDYYNHVDEENFVGFDFHHNGSVYKPVFGQYSTEIFTQRSEEIIKNHNASQPLFLYLAHQAVHSANKEDLLQAPQRYFDRFPNIAFKPRRKFAAMVAALDESVGNVTRALKDAGLYDNSIIIFTTDNGGPAHGFDGNYANNYPLRGLKHTLWEGGVRGAAFVHSPLIKNSSRISNDLLHVTDWLPTVYKLAGGNIEDLLAQDGFDVWKSISEGGASPRREILLNIDYGLYSAALRSGDYKIIVGEDYGGAYSGWYPPEGVDEPDKANSVPNAAVVSCPQKPSNASSNCKPMVKPCLYNVREDPCEFYNIADWNPDIVDAMMKRLNEYNATAVPSYRVPQDPQSNPKLHDGCWVPWM